MRGKHKSEFSFTKFLERKGRNTLTRIHMIRKMGAQANIIYCLLYSGIKFKNVVLLFEIIFIIFFNHIKVYNAST